MSREVGASTKDIHVFSIDGTDMAYDGASGALHRLSPVGRDVIKWSQDFSGERGDEAPQALLDSLKRYDPRDVRDSWTELRELTGRTLFTEDRTIEAALREGGDVADAGVKAMCLDVAHDCNLACSYCFASTGRFGGHPQVMTREAGTASVDFLIEASRARRFLDVDFFGGEPLMAFDVVREVVRYARAKGRERGKQFRFTLTTNCTLLDESKLAFLNDENISLILSVDGRPEVHNAKRRFRDGRPSHDLVIEKALQAVSSRGGRDYYVRGTYTEDNLDFDADLRYLYDRGFRKISIEPAVGEPGDGYSVQESDLPKVRESYLRAVDFWADCAAKGDPLEFYHFNLGLTGGLCRERRITGCGAGYEYVAVTPSGEVYPCHQLVGKPDYLLGDIRSGLRRFDIQKSFHDARVPNKPACLTCWARYLCGGGCHARSIASGLPLTTPDPVSCRIMTTRLEFALYAQIKRSQQKEI